MRSRSLRVTGLGADSTRMASSPPTAKCRNTARYGRPRRSATDRSATSIAAAPSEVCDELPAVMSGAMAGSHLAAEPRPASVSTVVSGADALVRRSSARRSRGPRRPAPAWGRSPSPNRPDSVVTWARRWDSAASRVHVLTSDPEPVGEDLGDLELDHEPLVDGVEVGGAERPRAAGGVGRHGDPAHRLHPAGDGHVVGPCHHALGCEVDGLLGAAALAVHRGGRDGLRQARRPPRSCG